MARGLDINYEDPDASTVVQVVVGEAHTLALTGEVLLIGLLVYSSGSASGQET